MVCVWQRTMQLRLICQRARPRFGSVCATRKNTRRYVFARRHSSFIYLIRVCSVCLCPFCFDLLCQPGYALSSAYPYPLLSLRLSFLFGFAVSVSVRPVFGVSVRCPSLCLRHLYVFTLCVALGATNPSPAVHQTVAGIGSFARISCMHSRR